MRVRLKLAHKLALLIAPLVLLLLGGALWQAHEQWQLARALQRDEALAGSVQSVGELIQALQIERGLSNRFLSAHQPPPPGLQQQRQRADEALARLRRQRARISPPSWPASWISNCRPRPRWPACGARWIRGMFRPCQLSIATPTSSKTCPG